MSATLPLTIIIIAVFDSLNPSLFIVQFFLLTTPRPVRTTISYIAGVVITNFFGGLLFLLGAQAFFATVVANLSATWLYGMGLALGLGLILFGFWMPRTIEANAPTHLLRSLHPFHTFLLGAFVMVNELTTALPYLVAIERIVSAGLSTAVAVFVLIFYNVIFALPLFAFLGLFMVYGARFAAQTERINAAIIAWTPLILKYGSLALGAFLTVNAISFFVRGASILG